MKVRTMHCQKQWASLGAQAYTQKKLKYKPFCTFVWVKACSQGICFSTEATHLQTLHRSFPTCLSLSLSSCFLYLPPVFLTLLPFSPSNKGPSINFHSSSSPSQCRLSKEPQTDKRPKKVKLLIWCHFQLEPREERSSTERGVSIEPERHHIGKINGQHKMEKFLCRLKKKRINLEISGLKKMLMWWYVCVYVCRRMHVCVFISTYHCVKELVTAGGDEHIISVPVHTRKARASQINKKSRGTMSRG